MQIRSIVRWGLRPFSGTQSCHKGCHNHTSCTSFKKMASFSSQRSQLFFFFFLLVLLFSLTWALRWGCLRWESSCRGLRGTPTWAACEAHGPSSWWTWPWWWWPRRRARGPPGHSPTRRRKPTADLWERRGWRGASDSECRQKRVCYFKRMEIGNKKVDV